MRSWKLASATAVALVMLLTPFIIWQYGESTTTAWFLAGIQGGIVLFLVIKVFYEFSD